MAIVRWEPFRELMDVQRSLDRVWGGMPARENFREFFEGAAMPLDIYYTDDALVVKAGAAGVKPEDIDITVTGDQLVIKGETASEETVKDEAYVCREIRRGSFGRTLTLPKDVSADKIEADYEDGLLVLTIPKGEAHKPRQIKVKTGKTVAGKKE